jgi:STE24 endopeptidase
MNAPFRVAAAAGVLIFARWAAQWWLEHLNRRHVLAHARAIPDAFKHTMDAPTYAKSVEYTLAQGLLAQVEAAFDLLVLCMVLFSGWLPRAYNIWTERMGASAWSMGGFLFAVGFALSLTGLPLSWYSQFRLEARFGFNTTTPGLWLLDRLKGFVLSLALGYPLLVLVLKLVEWMGPAWWLWAWGCVLAFQLVMAVLAPVVIMPLFNKFTPLPVGSLRDRLLALGDRTRFPARNIQVMDGSKRSRHSNAFFTGFGRFRKIVLFDTLIQQLAEPELEAVLAHEIGHYKKRHIVKMLAGSAIGLLAAFAALGWLAQQDWFYRAFGFEPDGMAPVLLLFGLLAGAVTFWLSPLLHAWSRRYEYQADAYAAQTMKESGSLIGALRKLNEKNLGNLTPHPVYSGFYYSHPTLLERERALKLVAASKT